jgi:riboflavin kinase / FMN adenylyltransferase
MQHLWSLANVNLDRSWLTIGSFDGVHRGHQEIVRNLSAGAHSVGAPAVVLSFYPHPSVVLGKRKHSFYLTSPEERAELLGMLGADIVVTHPFNPDIAQIEARDFVAYMHHHLKMERLKVGYDFAMGRGREGNVPALQKLGEEFGFEVEDIQPVKLDGRTVSSSFIRSLLQEGKVEEAARFLGRYYRLSGRVVSGEGRGRTMGIPTANLSLWEETLVPAPGVYVTHVHTRGAVYGAVTNVGFRPTFEPAPAAPRVETLLLDYSGDLYGEQISLDFLSRLREERRFPDAKSLLDQIDRDIQSAKNVLASGPKDPV